MVPLSSWAKRVAAIKALALDPDPLTLTLPWVRFSSVRLLVSQRAGVSPRFELNPNDAYALSCVCRFAAHHRLLGTGESRNEAGLRTDPPNAKKPYDCERRQGLRRLKNYDQAIAEMRKAL
jgi:hypothetical protein